MQEFALFSVDTRAIVSHIEARLLGVFHTLSWSVFEVPGNLSSLFDRFCEISERHVSVSAIFILAISLEEVQTWSRCTFILVASSFATSKSATLASTAKRTPTASRWRRRTLCVRLGNRTQTTHVPPTETTGNIRRMGNAMAPIPDRRG